MKDNITDPLRIGDFCIGILSTFILPYDFCREESHKFTLRIKDDDLNRIRNMIQTFIVPQDAYASPINKDCNPCCNLEEDARRAMCDCFHLDDHFLKKPNQKSKFYCERFLLHKIKINHPRFPDTWASVVLIVYFNMNCASLLINVNAKENEKVPKFTTDECLLLRELLHKETEFISWASNSRFWLKNAKVAQKQILEFQTKYPVSQFKIDYDGKAFPFKSFCKDYIEYLRRIFLYGFRCESKYFHFFGIRTKPSIPLNTFSQIKIWMTGTLFRKREILKSPSIYNQHLIEIKKAYWISEEKSLTPIETPDCLETNFHKQLYAILIGDEGWRFVPSKIAKKRLSDSWSTRDFARIFVCSHNILSINLKTSDYIQSQCDEWNFLRNWDTPPTTKLKNTIGYFKMNPCFAGLDHGILHIACKAEIIHTEVNNSLQIVMMSMRCSDIFSVIHRLANKRSEAIQSILSSFIGTHELDDLAKIIYKNKEIDTAINDLKYKVGLQGEMLSFLYQQQSNRGVSLLTWLTILVSVVAGVYSVSLKSSILPESIRNITRKICSEELAIEYLIVVLITLLAVRIIYGIWINHGRHNLNRKMKRRH